MIGHSNSNYVCGVDAEVSALNGTNGSRGSRFENATETDLWCCELTDWDQQRLFRDNYTLNVMWTAVASVFCVGGLLGALASNYLVFRFGRLVRMRGSRYFV